MSLDSALCLSARPRAAFPWDLTYTHHWNFSFFKPFILSDFQFFCSCFRYKCYVIVSSTDVVLSLLDRCFCLSSTDAVLALYDLCLFFFDKCFYLFYRCRVDSSQWMLFIFLWQILFYLSLRSRVLYFIDRSYAILALSDSIHAR